MAPGSTQVPSSISAASGAHPGLIDERAARAVHEAEDDRAQLRRLEECATRAALGIADRPAFAATATTAIASTTAAAAAAAAVDKRLAEGPATLAAKALAMGGGGPGGVGDPSRPPGSSREPWSSSSPVAPPDGAHSPNRRQGQWHHPHPTEAAAVAKSAAAPTMVVKINPNTTKSPHVPLDFDDPALTPEERFELRLTEARWRQRKRRRARRRQRSAGMATIARARVVTFHCVDDNSQRLRQAQSAHHQYSSAEDNGVSHIDAADGGHAANSGGDAGGVAGLGIGCAAAEAYNPSPAPPRRQAIEYMCAICNEAYPSTSELNPWWALTNHECLKCGKTQIPRLDITAPANALEYHPALVANTEENGGVGNNSKMVDDAMYSSVAESSYHQTVANQTTNATAATMEYQQTAFVQGGVTYITRGPTSAAAAAAAAAGMARDAMSFSDSSDVSRTDESDGEGGSGGGMNGGYNYDESSDDDDDDEMPLAGGGGSDDEDVDSTTIEQLEELAEREEFGYEYKGETLSDDQARRLLVLIEHASTCPGRHQSAEHRNVCHSTKYLMLHVRDCSGLLSNGDVCPFPWCRKVKHLLYHLVCCEEVGHCTICCPLEEKLSPNLNALVGLNSHRRDKFRERVKTVLAKRQQLAAAAAAARATSSATANPNNNAASHVGKPRTATVTAMVHPPRRPSAMMQSHAQHHRQHGAGILTAPHSTPASVSATQSSTTTSSAAIAATTFSWLHSQPQLPSPVLTSTFARFDSCASMSALPTLEEAAYELGDIALSTSDLVGLSSSSNNDLAASALNATSCTIKAEATTATDFSAL